MPVTSRLTTSPPAVLRAPGAPTSSSSPGSPPPPPLPPPQIPPHPGACRVEHAGGLPSQGRNTPLHPTLGTSPSPGRLRRGRGPEPHLQLRPSPGAHCPAQPGPEEPVRTGERLSARGTPKATGPARLPAPQPSHPPPGDRCRCRHHCRRSATSTTDAATATARSVARDVTAPRPLRETPSPAPQACDDGLRLRLARDRPGFPHSPRVAQGTSRPDLLRAQGMEAAGRPRRQVVTGRPN